MLLSVIYCLLLCSISYVQSRKDFSLVWCVNSNVIVDTAGWRQHLITALGDLIKPTRAVVCSGVSDGVIAIGIEVNGGSVKVLKKSPSDSIEDFIDDVTSEICNLRLTPITNPDDINSLINKHNELLVTFNDKLSPDYHEFCRGIFSPQVPQDLVIADIKQLKFLPAKERVAMDTELALWIVTEGIWGYVILNTTDGSGLTAIEVVDKLRQLNYPSILYYSGEDINDIYGGSNLHLMYIFYHKDQLDNIMNSYVRELAATFRAHYAFIMIDSEKYSDQTRQHMIEKSDLPIIVLKRPNKYDSSGIQIRQEHISYKFETLSHLMVNVILPDGLSPQDEDEGERDNEGNLIDNMPISFLDIKSLNDLRRDETPTIFIACERDSIDCTRVEKSMEKAKKAVLKVNPEYELRIFIIEVKDVKELHQYEIEVNSLPKVIVKEDNEFRPYESHMKAADFVKIIINFSKKGKDGKEEDKFVSEEDYYSQFEELKEDEPMGILYPFMLPHYGSHLTNENASQFIQQSKNSLVAFYVPYCIPCRPMLQNVMELNDTLYKMGIDVALVNCAGYPDVCQSFNVTAFPTLLMKRDGSTDSTWNTYDGIVSHEELLNSLTGQNNSPSNIELTPTSLMTMFRSSSGNMKSLVVYFDHELSDGKADLFTRISVNQIYWLNSTRYSHVANKLAGSNPLPLLMLIDYDNRHVYHMAIGDTAGVDEVKTFISDVLGGKRPADVTLDKATWTPFKPAVKFPSEAYTRQHGRGDSKNDIKENDNIKADSPLTSSRLPNSHSSHEEL